MDPEKTILENLGDDEAAAPSVMGRVRMMCSLLASDKGEYEDLCILIGKHIADAVAEEREACARVVLDEYGDPGHVLVRKIRERSGRLPEQEPARPSALLPARTASGTISGEKKR